MNKKTPFTIRLRSDLLADIKTVATQDQVTMTNVIEAALDDFLPIRKKNIENKLEKVQKVLRIQGL